ncbi:MAG: hypothetical protein PUA63_07240 [Oscillospiraceae bacterium]|nr:hypothetical protein [Oscillospiraceae bacterium]
MSKQKIARLADRPADYQKLGQKKEIAQWEDGHRTNGKFGEYEWWYFDGKMDDGSSLVIVFYTQPVTAIAPGYAPSVSFSLTRDGKQIQDSVSFKKTECSFDREKCCNKLGSSFCEGNLHDYKLHYESDKIRADVTLHSNSEPWRPETGYFLFDEKKYFAWLPSVPEGKMEAVITIDGETIRLSGTGYHDHNWGNTGMFWIMHHWYWGRAKIGDYQVISSYITAHKPYGYEHFPIFLLSKNGEKLGDDPKYLTYTQSDPEFDPITQKHYHKKLVYDYNDGTQHYRITYAAEKIIETFVVADSKSSAAAKSNPVQLWLVKKAGLAPSYIRMVGTVTLERFENDKAVETIFSPGLWEQMYFGLDEDV